MRRAFKFYVIFACIILIGNFLILREDHNTSAVKTGTVYFSRSDEWNSIMASNINTRGIKLQIDGKNVNLDNKAIVMDDDLNILMAFDVFREVFSCAANYYNSNRLVVEKFTTRLILTLNQSTMMMNEESVELSSKVVKINERTYVPVDIAEKGLSYAGSWDVATNTLAFTNQKPDEKIVPYIYDYRTEGKLPIIKNQSTFGTCWAFAALTALETTLAPDQLFDFSEDHMSINNNFSMTQNDGGEYTMAMAYLASWTGPVLEEDDPYGDGYSPDGLEAVVHVQEAQILESKNYDTIKKAVFLYGGVQSSLYVELVDANSSSEYYNKDFSAYCYIGPEKPNHDIVIIGWDDTYPASKFGAEPEGDGAFICANSWGEEFGEKGVFYVSYYDSNIGVHNVVYTNVEGTDNYDSIYQSDLCGWVGQIGYNRDYAYFANVYTAKNDETLEAVSFYATGADTSYDLYIVEDYQNEASFANRRLLSSGSFLNAGYYTVDINERIEMEPGVNYAIIVYIKTPNSERPVAVEYQGDESTNSVIIEDGHGYISLDGNIWMSAEESKDCNVCLKMFTNFIKEK